MLRHGYCLPHHITAKTSKTAVLFLSRFCLLSFSSKAPTKQAPWSEELCKCAAKRYLAKWNIDRSVSRGPSGLIAEDSYITVSVFESLLLSETHTIAEREGWEFCSRNELIAAPANLNGSGHQ